MAAMKKPWPPFTSDGIYATKCILAGRVPVVAHCGDSLRTIASMSVDLDVLDDVIRARLLADDDLSGPLCRILNSMPRARVNTGMSEHDSAIALEVALRAIVVFTRLSVIAGLSLYGVGHRAKSPDTLIDEAMKLQLRTLRYCAVCGKVFRFGRDRKLTCGNPRCRRLAARRQRPGHAEKVRAARWRGLITAFSQTLERVSGVAPVTRVKLGAVEQWLERYRDGDLIAERELETLAEVHPDFQSIVNRVSRYRTSHRRRGRIPR